MLKTLKIAAAIGTIFIITNCCAAQTTPPVEPKAIKTITFPTDFVSAAGGFKIDLPASAVRQRALRIGRRFAGDAVQYEWTTIRGDYLITYSDLTEPLGGEETRRFLKASGDRLTEETVASGGKSIDSREISLDGNPGFEVKVRFSSKNIGIGRFFVVKKRVYTLFSGWDDGETGEMQIKTLDSFSLLK